MFKATLVIIIIGMHSEHPPIPLSMLMIFPRQKNLQLTFTIWTKTSQLIRNIRRGGLNMKGLVQVSACFVTFAKNCMMYRVSHKMYTENNKSPVCIVCMP